MKKATNIFLAAASFFVLFPVRAQALFHLAVIDEILASYEGNPQVQFVEVRMELALQRFVRNSVLGVFDADGNYLGDLLVLPNDVPRDGADVRWILGTEALVERSGLTVDFTIPPGLPVEGGMVCWGAPGIVVPSPDTWDHTDPENYVDCVAYGNYRGPTNRLVGRPTPLDPSGHSLVRISETNDNATDFACSAMATPENNAGDTVLLPASSPCPVDLATLLSALFSPEPPGEADLNTDGRVSAADIVALFL